jgi:hypothetical protein
VLSIVVLSEVAVREANVTAVEGSLRAFSKVAMERRSPNPPVGSQHASAVGLWGLAIVLTCVPATIAQSDSAIDGTVSAEGGQPIADVYVVGSQSKSCCPFKRESTKTNEKGEFHLEHPGAVVHLSKQGFEPRALVVQPVNGRVNVTLSASSGDLTAPACGPRKRGTKRIGWQLTFFDVPGRNVILSGGKWDVDYVVYSVKPKSGESYLQLWFGPYAISTVPDDEDFVSSVSFSERNIVAPSIGEVGIDTRGNLASRERWRQTVVGGMGGARYKAKTPEDAILFDQIVDSICLVPLPIDKTKQPSPQSKP